MTTMQTVSGSGIYCIRNIATGKRYIGSAVNLKQRFKQHRSDLNVGSHCNAILLASWRKHGKDTFEFDVIEPVFIKENLIAREQFWIDSFQSADRDFGYNIRPTAGSNLGTKCSPESVEKRAAKLRGIKRTPEVCAKISAAKIGKLRPGVGAKVSASLTGYKHTAEARSNMKAGRDLAGRSHSEETKKKLSEQRKGVPFSDAHRAKISEVQMGRKQSPEHIAKRMATIKARRLQNVFNC